MPTTSEAAKRSSTWRKIAIGVLAVFLVAVLAYTGLFFVSGMQVEREIARLEQRFGNLGESSLVVEAVPPKENRALVVRRAAALVDRQHWDSVVSSLSNYLIRASALPVPTDARAFAEASRSAIQLADQISSRSRSNYEVDYLTGDWPDLMSIRILSNALYIDVGVQLEAGRLDVAARRVSSAIAIGASFRQEPSLLMQLMRISLTTRACDGVEDLITLAEPSRDSLRELASRLAENRDPDPMRIGLLSELKFNVAFLRRIDAGTASAPDAYRGAFHAWTKGPMRFLSRPVHRLALVRYLRDAEKLIDLQAGPRPRPALEESPGAARWNLPERLAEDFSAGLLRSIESGDQFDGVLGATQIAVALRRHRLDHGVYPAGLPALVPAYLPEVPIDPFTGKPPLYVRDGSGFTLKAENASGVVLRKSALTWAVSK